MYTQTAVCLAFLRSKDIGLSVCVLSESSRSNGVAYQLHSACNNNVFVKVKSNFIYYGLIIGIGV